MAVSGRSNMDLEPDPDTEWFFSTLIQIRPLKVKIFKHYIGIFCLNGLIRSCLWIRSWSRNGFPNPNPTWPKSSGFDRIRIRPDTDPQHWLWPTHTSVTLPVATIYRSVLYLYKWNYCPCLQSKKKVSDFPNSPCPGLPLGRVCLVTSRLVLGKSLALFTV
jgi:hypothetical protein